MTTIETTTPKRKVGILLAIGIVFVPIIFSWFTLRKGHSVLSRVLSLGWLALATLLVVLSPPAPSPTGADVEAPQSATLTPQSESPATTTRPVAEPVRPKSGVTMANYQRIQTGMSYAQVADILGKPGEELSSNEIGGTRTVMYQWNGSFGANMNAMFQNGELVQKAQFGLK